MKVIGNLLATIGILLFIYTIVSRFVSAECALSLANLPVLGGKFTLVGMLSGTACILLIAVIALLKAKE